MSAHVLTCMERKRHRHFATTGPVGITGAAHKTGLKVSREATPDTYTLAEKKMMALIFPFVARLTKVQVKLIGDTVTSIETKALVETLSDPLMKMKSWRRSTQSITREQGRRSRRLVTHLP